jgi:hypothetical protein
VTGFQGGALYCEFNRHSSIVFDISDLAAENKTRAAQKIVPPGKLT